MPIESDLNVDVVYVVRCLECEHCVSGSNGNLECPYSTVDLEVNGYCSHGVRKESEND